MFPDWYVLEIIIWPAVVNSTIPMVYVSPCDSVAWIDSGWLNAVRPKSNVITKLKKVFIINVKINNNSHNFLYSFIRFSFCPSPRNEEKLRIVSLIYYKIILALSNVSYFSSQRVRFQLYSLFKWTQGFTSFSGEMWTPILKTSFVRKFSSTYFFMVYYSNPLIKAIYKGFNHIIPLLYLVYLL